MSTAAVPAPNFRPSRALASPRLAALPREARDKFERLRQLEARTAAMRDGLLDQRHRIRAELEDTQRTLGRFDRDNDVERAFTYEEDEKTGKRQRVPAVFPERVKLVEQIGAMREEMARIDADIAAANLGFTTDGIIDWLNHDVPTVARFAAVPKPKFSINRGESLADVLAANRQEQALITEKIAELETAHTTVAEAQARMRADVDALAERGRPDVTGVLFGGAVQWPTKQLVTDVHGEGHSHVGTATVDDAVALAVWACRDEIVAKLSAEIEVAGDDKTAVAAADRPGLIAANKAKLLELQHVAEAIICRMEAEGHFVTRACTSPLVLLGIDDGTLSVRSH
jgi:hypothetical protein